MNKRLIIAKPAQSFFDLANCPTQYGDSYPMNKPYIKMSRTSSKFSRYHVGKPVTFKREEDHTLTAMMYYNITVKNVSIENPLKFNDVSVKIVGPKAEQIKNSISDPTCMTTLHDKAFHIFIAERAQEIELRLSFQPEEVRQSVLPIRLLPVFSFEHFNQPRDGIINVMMEMEEAYILESPIL